MELVQNENAVSSEVLGALEGVQNDFTVNRENEVMVEEALLDVDIVHPVEVVFDFLWLVILRGVSESVRDHQSFN